jgi:hypothetical protein
VTAAEPKVTLDLATAHGLTAEEYDRIIRRLGREPTFTELGLFSALWSEHCAYKHSRVFLRSHPTRAAHVLQGPGENAGIVDLGGDLALTFKIESHNHPSFIEPFQGAATGVGGILRDIFTMGARPIAVLDSLRFGDPADPRQRRLIEGVVSGIGWYGVRYEMFKRLGYFVTESSEHFAEYTPWFIKRDRDDLLEEFNIPLDEYIRRCEAQIAGWEGMRVAMEDPNQQIEVRPSMEYGSQIIAAMETGDPVVIYGNVPNNGLIDNLPQGCSVEVPCLIDKSGIQPTKIGALPPHLAALMQTNINVQALTVEAAVTGKREHIYHAAMLDPHTAAELSLDQIWNLVDDLIEAHGDWLPHYN